METSDAPRGLRHFFATTLWELDPDASTGLKRHAIRALQFLALVVKDFWDDQCLLHAGALSFTSILSLVPLFALAFAVLKGLGVPNKLEPLILEQVTAGSQELVEKIISYINNTNMTSLGAIGLGALVITAVSLLANIEEAFNAIWGVRETRSLPRKVSNYLSVVVFGPLLLLAATSITSSLESQAVVRWLMENAYIGDAVLFLFRLTPYLSIWIALVFLYLFMPNTRVHFGSALLGGLLAGTAWHFAQWGYIHFQLGVARYNAIYGTVAVLPIFMVWLYTSWVIVLFGVEVVYAHQNIRTFVRERRLPGLSYGVREFLALSLLQEIAGAFHAGAPPRPVETLAAILDIPARIAHELLELLTTAGFLVPVCSECAGYQPARELERISVAEVIATLREQGGVYPIRRFTAGEEQVRQLLVRLENCRTETLAGITLRDLVPGPPAPREPNGPASSERPPR